MDRAIDVGGVRQSPLGQFFAGPRVQNVKSTGAAIDEFAVDKVLPIGLDVRHHASRIQLCRAFTECSELTPHAGSRTNGPGV